jgi:hypothetical protein
LSFSFFGSSQKFFLVQIGKVARLLAGSSLVSHPDIYQNLKKVKLSKGVANTL